MAAYHHRWQDIVVVSPACISLAWSTAIWSRTDLAELATRQLSYYTVSVVAVFQLPHEAWTAIQSAYHRYVRYDHMDLPKPSQGGCYDQSTFSTIMFIYIYIVTDLADLHLPLIWKGYIFLCFFLRYAQVKIYICITSRWNIFPIHSEQINLYMFDS